MLAPYIVTTAEQQSRFYQLWDEFVAECEQETLGEQAHNPVSSGPLPWYLRYRKLMLAVVLLPLLAWFFYEYFKVAKPDFVTAVSISSDYRELATEGETLKIYNATPVNNPVDSTKFIWTVKDNQRDSILHTSTDFELDWTIPLGTGRQLLVTLEAPEFTAAESFRRSDIFRTVVMCADPPKVDSLILPPTPYNVGDRRTFSIPSPEKGVIYRWRFSQDKKDYFGNSIQFTFQEEGPIRIEMLAMLASDTAYCTKLMIEDRFVGSNLPFLVSIPLEEDKGTQQLTLAGGVWFLLLFPLLLSLPLWYRWWKKRREKEAPEKTSEELQAAYPIHDQGPYDIPYRSQDGQITAPADFFRMADQLRIREAGLRRHFDARSTVDATIKSGGFPKWKDRPIKRPAAYLMLIRHTDEHQQQDRLMTRLAQFLIDQEAGLTVYYHSGSYAHFWNEDYPNGWPLDQLYSRYQEHRLIVAGDAHGLVDNYAAEQPRLKKQLKKVMLRWDRRLVLTTEPVADWSFQEVLLHRHFILYPATAKGIRAGIAELNETEEYEAGNYLNWEKELARQHPEPTCRYRKWETVADHEAYLADDPVLFRWLSGLAVCSRPNWDLTIAIGRAFGIEVTHDRLLRLSRIPWLADNQPDHALRMALLATLNPEDEKLARQCVIEELEAVSPLVKNSFAETEWTTNQALQNFALAPHDPNNKQAIRDLKALGYLSNDQLAELDQSLLNNTDAATLKSQTNNATTTGFNGSKNLDDWLDATEPRPWFTLELFFAILLGLVSLVLALAANDFERANPPFEGQELAFWQITESTEDRAKDLNNEAVAMWRVNDQIDRVDPWNVIINRWDEAEQKLQEAIELRSPADYPRADSNLLALTYNRVQKHFNFYLQDSIDFARWSAEKPLELLAPYFGPEDTLATDMRTLLLRHEIGLVQLKLFDAYRLMTRNSPDGFDRVLFNADAARPIPEKYRYFFDGQETIDLQAFTHGYLLVDAVNNYAFLDTVRNGTFFDSIRVAMPYNLRTEIQPYLKGLSVEVQDMQDLVPSRTEQEVDKLNPTPLNPNPSTTGSGDSIILSNDPFERVLQAHELGAYKKIVSVQAPESNRETLPSYLTSLLRNNRSSAFTTADNWIDLLQRDLPNVNTRDMAGVVGIFKGNFLFVGDNPRAVDERLVGIKDNSEALVLLSKARGGTTRPVSEITSENELISELENSGFQVTVKAGEEQESLRSRIQTLFQRYRSTKVPNRQLLVYLSASYDPATGKILNESVGKGGATYTVDELSSLLEALPVEHILVLLNLIEVEAPQVEYFTPKMVNVPGGAFVMGNTFSTDPAAEVDEIPTRPVRIPAFQMAETEVTVKEYNAALIAWDIGEDVGGYDRPVLKVNWVEAISYCNWLSAQAGLEPVYSTRAAGGQVSQDEWAGQAYNPSFISPGTSSEIIANWQANGYRLPTEAEWEYAASYRDGTGKARFGTGENNINKIGDARYRSSGPVPVKYYDPNPLGLYDLAGNASEWCWDMYSVYPVSQVETLHPKGADYSNYRTARGGSFRGYDSDLRATNRLNVDPALKASDLGFRLARNAQ